MSKKKSLCLGIDTTSDAVCVACVDESNHSSYLYQQMFHGQGEVLMTLIQNVLNALNKKPKDLTHIAVTVGPGSFTGVRIGLATARGLGLALKIPVIGVDNFTATSFFYNLKTTHKVVIDSKRDDYFVQSFDTKGIAKGKPRLYTKDELKKQLPFIACGTGANQLANEIGCQIASMDKPLLALAAAQIALTAPNKTTDAHPLYLRDADVTI